MRAPCLRSALVVLAVFVAAAHVDARQMFQAKPSNQPAPQGTKPSQVKVVNTAQEAVPVTASAPLPVSGAVSVTGPITVANTAPIPVRMDQPQSESKTLFFESYFPAGTTQSACGGDRPVDLLYTVPPGKRLVIEYVSVEALLTYAGQTPGFILVGKMNTGFEPQPVGKTVSGSSLNSMHVMTRLYFEAGQEVIACAFRDASAGEANVRVTLSGMVTSVQ